MDSLDDSITRVMNLQKPLGEPDSLNLTSKLSFLLNMSQSKAKSQERCKCMNCWPDKSLSHTHTRTRTHAPPQRSAVCLLQLAKHLG